MSARKKPKTSKSEIESLLDFFAGEATPSLLEALRDPDSEASKLLQTTQAVARRAREVDPQLVVKALLKEEDPPTSQCTAKKNRFPDTPTAKANPRRKRPLRNAADLSGNDPKDADCPSEETVLFEAAMGASTVSELPKVHPIELSGLDSGPPITGWAEWIPQEGTAGGPCEEWCVTLKFPASKNCCRRGNSRHSLNQLEGSLVGIKVSGPLREDRINVRLDFDERDDLVSNPRLVRLSSPLLEAEAITVFREDRTEDGACVVSFPLIGQPLPDVERFDGAAGFVEAVGREPPEWLFHLRVSPTKQVATSRFDPVTDRDLEDLIDRLRLRMLRNPLTGYRIEPMEFPHGRLPDPAGCSEYAFALPPHILGDSYALALAAGLVGAATGRPLPSWVLFSSGMHLRSLDLTRTGCIKRKLKLALDAGLGRGNHMRLLGRLYEHPSTSGHMGEHHERVIPGRLRLFLVASELDVPLETLSPPLVVDPVAARIEDFGQESFEQLLKVVDELAGGDLLVVQLSNVFEALYLLGYHHQHQHIEVELQQHPATFPVRVFRVRYDRDRDRARSVSRFKRGMWGGPEHWHYLARTNLDALDDELSKSDDVLQQLKIVLDRCIDVTARYVEDAGESYPAGRAGAYSGDISVVDPTDPSGKWLRTVAVSGNDPHAMPYFLPATVGLASRVVQTGKTAVIACPGEDPHIRAVTAAGSPLLMRYGYKSVQRYRAFLKKIRCSLNVPLKRGSKVVGILGIHCHTEKQLAPNLVRLVEKLAKRAAIELAFYLGGQCRLAAPPEGQGSVEQLAKQISRFRCRPELALREISDGLTSVVVARTGAWRAGVRLLTPDRKALVDICHRGFWTEGTLAEEVSLAEDTAGTYAVKSGRSYYIDDTRQAYMEQNNEWVPVHYRPCLPEAKSHASVLLRAGGHLLGALCVDWDHPGALDTCTRQTLEQLAERYAVALKAFAGDSLVGLIDHNLTSDAEGRFSLDYCGFLQVVAGMVGAQQGAIFIRRPETGRYHLVANLAHRDWSGEDKWYEPGEGVTGWVIKHNRPLRVGDLTDRAELLNADPEDPPVWVDKVYDGEVRDDRNWTYLGVPIAVGSEVLGVLRVANGINDVGFSSYEQATAMAAVAQLAGLLHQREQARKSETLVRLASRIAQARSLEQLIEDIFDALTTGVGKCSCCIRLVDKFDRPNGEPIEVLTRVASNDPVWEKAPVMRTRGEGIAGRVWQSLDTASFGSPDEPQIVTLIGQDKSTCEVLKGFGSGVCVPLRSKGVLSGTLFLCRENRWALTPGDLSFVETVGDLVGYALVAVAEQQSHALELSLQHLLGEYFRKPSSDKELSQWRSKTVTELVEQLFRAVGGDQGWLWDFEAGSRLFCLAYGSTPHEMTPGNISEQKALQELGGRSFIAVSRPAEDARLMGLFDGAEAAGREKMTRATRTAVLVTDDEKPVMLFAAAGSLGQPISYRRVERLAEILGRLSQPLSAILRIGSSPANQVTHTAKARPEMT